MCVQLVGSPPNYAESFVLHYPPVMDVSRFGSLKKLLSTMIIVYRFGTPLGARIPMSTAEERKRAMGKLIAMEQRNHFAEEIGCLQKKMAIPKTSRLVELDPYLQDNGIMKMNGRVNKDLILLDNKSDLTKLITNDVHQKNLHCGPNQTLAMLRQEYWSNSHHIYEKCTFLSNLFGTL